MPKGKRKNMRQNRGKRRARGRPSGRVVSVRRALVLRPMKLDPSIPLTVGWSNQAPPEATPQQPRVVFELNMGNVMLSRARRLGFGEGAGTITNFYPLFQGMKIESVNVLFRPTSFSSHDAGYCVVTLASNRSRSQSFDLKYMSPEVVSKKLFRHNDPLQNLDLFWAYNWETLSYNSTQNLFPSLSSPLIRIEHDGYIVVRVHALMTPQDGSLNANYEPCSFCLRSSVRYHQRQCTDGSRLCHLGWKDGPLELCHFVSRQPQIF